MESGVRPFGSPKDKKDELARFSPRGADRRAGCSLATTDDINESLPLPHTAGAMSASSSDDDDDFAAELEAEMVVRDSRRARRGGQASTRGRRWRDCVAAPRRDAQGGGASVRDRGGRGAAATHGAEEVKRRRVPRPRVRPRRAVPRRPPRRARPIRVPDGHLRSLRRAAEKGSATEASAPATTSMRYIHEGLELSNAELDRAKREERARVLRSGKLLLVLDLDHTLLNSARFSDLSQAQHNALGMVILARAAERTGHSQEEIDTLVKNVETEIAERAKARAEARAKSDAREDADVPPAASLDVAAASEASFRPGVLLP